MSTLVLKKTMTRQLTKEEDAELLAYFEAHLEDDLEGVLEMFEKKFGTPITQHRLMRLVIEKDLGG